MATYYWVGGNGTWDNASTTNWAASSGGAGGVGPPLAADIVNFDSASGTGTCTTAAGAVASQVVLNTSTLALTLGANLTLVGGFTYTLGTVNLSTFTFSSTTLVSSNTNTRVLNFGTGNITLTGNNTTIWNAGNMTNFSHTGTPTVNCTYSGSTGTRTISAGGTGGTEANALNFNISAGTDIVSFTGVANRNVNFTGFSGSVANAARFFYGNIITSTGMTWTAGAAATTLSGTGIQQITTAGKTLDFPLTQNGVGGTVQLQDNLTMGSTRTYTLTNGTLVLNNLTLSTGLFASTNSNTRVIAFGTGNITTIGSGTVWTTASTTGFSYTGTPTVNISNNSATATTVSTGAMIEARALNFNYTTGTYTLTDTNDVYKSVNFTGFSGTIPNSTRTIYGGATFSAGMTLTAGANTTTFAATSGTNNITTAAKTLDFPITFFGLGGTFAFQDALTQGATRAFTFTAGTVQFKASATSTTGVFATSGASQKFLQSTTPGTQATLSQASGTVDVSHLTIQDNAAVGGATFNAFVDQSNVDAGNVDGWNFGISPIVGGAEYTYSMRSFTQSRRF
jgi:hypothetical protein